MPVKDFVAAFADVAEHSPWVARRAAAARPFATLDAMIQVFTDAVGVVSHKKQLALLRAHPNLAAKAKLTDESLREQSSAGLDTLTAEELARFTQLNRLYQAKFGFPFILAVKDATKQQILDSFEERVNNPAEVEFATAVAQVYRILRFRIEDRVSP
ncbi:MAG: 2-oxo-4-hydroxy-4-carboxy-5-ureidoimidazoline decarboxylase [Rhizobiales bacterium]|nr:2-oxo-4-hydroxy-4-carboxy-5-ureidoimidazoline decarboxylase [Hyphomicrobiales bacterium]